jgi:DNA-binding SARP family transcriptional activator
MSESFSLTNRLRRMLRLKVFGTLQLGDERGPLVDVVVQPKAVALLVFLALARPRGPQQRDRLVGLFWPESDQERARAALRKTLHRLRQELGEEVIVGHGNEAIALTSGLWCDAVAFDEALDAGLLLQALDYYEGELLPGFFVPDSGEFEAWLETERARYRANAVSAAWTLVEMFENDNKLTNATHLARVVARLAPSDERMLRKVISFLARHGDYAGAIETYKQFAQRLWRDYETRPSPETLRLIESIQGTTGE